MNKIREYILEAGLELVSHNDPKSDHPRLSIRIHRDDGSVDHYDSENIHPDHVRELKRRSKNPQSALKYWSNKVSHRPGVEKTTPKTPAELEKESGFVLNRVANFRAKQKEYLDKLKK